MSKKIKVRNPNPFHVGLNYSDGVKSIVVPPKLSIPVPEDEIDYINSTSAIFRRRLLIIEDEQKNIELGYAEDNVATYTDEQIRDLLKEHLNKIKPALKKVTEKHVIDRVISIAKEDTNMNMNKLRFFEEWSGYDMKALIEDNEKKERRKERS